MHFRFMWILALALALALAACAAPQRTADFARAEARARDRCDVARRADFADAGAVQLERYAAWLARTRGAGVSLSPADVSLAIVGGDPKPSPNGVTAGEVACGNNAGAPPYRITLFSEALEGRPLAVAYTTVAHEFQHLVQIRRDGLPCEAHGTALVRYEEEARAVADRVAPPCR